MRRKDDDQEPAESPGRCEPGGIQVVRWPAEGAAKGKLSMLQRMGDTTTNSVISRNGQGNAFSLVVDSEDYELPRLCLCGNEGRLYLHHRHGGIQSLFGQNSVHYVYLLYKVLTFRIGRAKHFLIFYHKISVFSIVFKQNRHFRRAFFLFYAFCIFLNIFVYKIDKILTIHLTFSFIMI